MIDNIKFNIWLPFQKHGIIQKTHTLMEEIEVANLINEVTNEVSLSTDMSSTIEKILYCRT